MKEGNIMRLALMRASKIGARLFRNHVGVGYQGKVIKFFKPTKVEVFPGDVLLREAYTMTFGLCPGSSDCIGWRSIIITPEMVGRPIAVFAAAEVKTDLGQPTDEQLHFIDIVQKAGGIAGIVRSESEVEELLTNVSGVLVRSPRG